MFGSSYWPASANLNIHRGETLSNLVIAQLGEDGSVEIANPLQECHVIAERNGLLRRLI
jgi:hypothetical protein